jgi:hypothetical protein
VTGVGSVRPRVPTDADADAWTELFDDPEVMRYVGTGEVRDRDRYRAFVRRQQEPTDRTGLCMFTAPAGETEIGWRLGAAAGWSLRTPQGVPGHENGSITVQRRSQLPTRVVHR